MGLTYSNSTKKKMGRPFLAQNWLTPGDLSNLLHLSGFEEIKTWQEIILPIQIPVLINLFNRYLVKLWPFKFIALNNFTLARKNVLNDQMAKSVSVIVAARNEEGHIKELFQSAKNGKFYRTHFCRRRFY